MKILERLKVWWNTPSEPTGMEAAGIEFHRRLKSHFRCHECGRYLDVGPRVCRGLGPMGVRCFHPRGTVVIWEERTNEVD